MKKLGLLINLIFASVLCIANSDFQDRVAAINNTLKDVKKSQDLNVPLIAYHLRGKNIDKYMQTALKLAKKEDFGFQGFTMQHFYNGLDELELGPKTHGESRSPEHLKNTAYHELGHACVAASLCKDQVVARISIEDRGLFTGGFYNLVSVNEDKLTRSYEDDQRRLNEGATLGECMPKFQEIISVALAGGVAEQVFAVHQELGTKRGLSKLFSNLGVGGMPGFEYIVPTDASIETHLIGYNACTVPVLLLGGYYSDLFKATTVAGLSIFAPKELGHKLYGVMLFSISIGISSYLCAVVSPLALVVLPTTLILNVLSPNRTAQKEVLLEGYDEAQAIIIANKDKIELLAKELVEKKYLPGQRVYDVLNIKRPKYSFEG